MSIAAEIIELEATARAAGLRLSEVLQSAGGDRSTWGRWRSGLTTPRLDNWRSAHEAVDGLIRKQRSLAPIARTRVPREEADANG